MKNKIKNFINKYGSKITVNSVDYYVLIRLATTSEVKNYLDDMEYLAVVKPSYYLTLPFDSGISEGSTFILDSRTFTIKKITNIYYKSEILYKVCLAY